ncbi:HNH endonuclease [Streptomyces sp. NPDC004976]
MWRGRGTLPEGQAVCRPCRREKPAAYSRPELYEPRPCSHCGAPVTDPARVTCSDGCLRGRLGSNARRLNAAPASRLPCNDCGKPTTRGKNQAGRFCRDCSKRRAKIRSARKDHGWTKSALLPSVLALAARDEYTCHVCGQAVDVSLPYNDRMAPTRDHIVPRRAGGSHDPSNLKLAHRGCNSRRGAPLAA